VLMEGIMGEALDKSHQVWVHQGLHRSKYNHAVNLRT